MLKIILVFLSVVYAYATILIPSSLSVHITSLKQCDDGDFPLQVSNIAVELKQGKVIVSGTMSTSIDIKSPVKAAVKVKRETLGVWIEIPCVDKVGTCTYDDLCVHSIPANRTCPKTFTDNDVPCRCPIPKGTYTIDPSIELQVEMYNYFSAYSGKYWAHLSLSEEGVNLITCYEVNFVIEDHKPKTINDIPFVELI